MQHNQITSHITIIIIIYILFLLTDLDVDVDLLLLVTVDHGAILDDEPVLGALEVDGHLLHRGDHRGDS